MSDSFMLSFSLKKPLASVIEDDEIASWDGNEDEDKGEIRRTKEKVDVKTISWVEKYAPKQFQEMKLHHSKTKALQEWINAGIEYQQRKDASRRLPILFMYGNSGGGKSTAIELLCKQSNIFIRNWQSTTDYSQFNSSFKSLSLSNSANSSVRRRRKKGSNILDSFYDEEDDFFDDEDDLHYQNRISEQEKMLSELSLHSKYQSLNLTVAKTATNSTSSSSSKTKIQLISSQIKPKTVESSQPSILLIEENIFQTPQTTERGSSNPELILETLLSLSIPIVMVISDSLHKEDQFQLERSLLSTSTTSFSLQQRFDIEWMYWAPITENKIQSHLNTIRDREKLPSSVFTSDILQDLAVSCNGDIRHAINELEFYAIKWKQDQTITQFSAEKFADLTGKGKKRKAVSGGKGKVEPKKKLKSSKKEKDDDIIDLTGDINSDDDEAQMLSKSFSMPSNQSSTSSISSTPVILSNFSNQSYNPSNPLQRQDSHTFIPSSSSSAASLMLSRDVHYSRSHCIAKFLHAKLNQDGLSDCAYDESIARSDLTIEYLMNTLQYNAIDNIESVMTAANIPNQANQSVEDMQVKILHSIHQAFHCFSDNDIWQSRKYDPSAHIDRSSFSNDIPHHLNFPEVYVTATSSRVLSVVRERGCLENYEIAKKQYHYKPPFTAVKSSPSYQHRMKRLEKQFQFQRVRLEEQERRVILHQQYPMFFGGFMMDTIGLYAIDIFPLHLYHPTRPVLPTNNNHLIPSQHSNKIEGEIEDDIEDIE